MKATLVKSGTRGATMTTTEAVANEQRKAQQT